jgi:uncharacterized protein YndB with AHSA1/START domain
MDAQLGHVERTGDGRVQLQFTRRFRHPPEKVWRALTEPDHLAAWFPTRIEGERAPGAALRFVFPNAEGPALAGEMLTYEPPSLMEFRWGNDDLRFELRPDGEGSILTFVDVFDEFGRAARDAAGWHTCLELLEYHLDGNTPAFSQGEHWPEIHKAYVEHLGPEAATIGPPASSSVKTN